MEFSKVSFCFYLEFPKHAGGTECQVIEFQVDRVPGWLSAKGLSAKEPSAKCDQVPSLLSAKYDRVPSGPSANYDRVPNTTKCQDIVRL